jgi:hypothetical protein
MQKLFGVCLTSGGMVHGRPLEYDPILPELRKTGIGNSSSKFAIFRDSGLDLFPMSPHLDSPSPGISREVERRGKLDTLPT